MTVWKSVLRVACLTPVVPSGLECIRYGFVVVVGWPVVAVMQVPESLSARGAVCDGLEVRPTGCVADACRPFGTGMHSVSFCGRSWVARFYGDVGA